MSEVRATMLAQPSKLSAYITLTKPDVSFLVLMTTGAGYYMGARGPIGWLHMIHVIVATMMIAAGTAALNHYVERESDRYMRRTASRPLPTGVLTPAEALRFGIILSLVSTPLKNRAVWAPSSAAIPGASPPMIGWTAATGKIDAGAWLLFAILFVWQFPHFHAISWMYREDYARAGILMLPVVDKEGQRTFRQIVLYAVALVAVSLLPAIMGFAGVLYFFGALVTCTGLVQVCLWAAHAKTNTRAKWLMHATVLHIPILLALTIYA